MAYTIIDYVNLRGNLTVEKDPYNELDALVFSLISYFDLSQISLPLTIKDSYKCYETLHFNHMLNSNDEILFKALAHSERYQNIKIIHFQSELDKEKIKQFAATTLLLEDETMVISYRGTDDSLIGWHEDFLMLCDPVILSQQSALEYLNMINDYQSSLHDYINNPYLGNIFHKISKYFKYKKHRPLWLLGHSKGGNLAIYAASLCDERIQDRIIKIDNFDGPGFQENMINHPGYQKILPKILTTAPHYSFFGIILDHQEKYKFVESQNAGMYQHDIYSWCIDIHGFVSSTLSQDSLAFANEIQTFLNKLTNAEKHQFVEALFDLFDKLDIHYFSQLSNISLKHIFNGIKEMTMIDAHTRKILIEAINMLWKESAKAKINMPTPTAK